MKRSPAAVEQHGALAAQRLGEQEAVVDERGRVELHELEVGQCGAGAVGEREPFAERALRVRRSLPESRVAAGRKEGCGRGERPVVCEHTGAATVGFPEAEHAHVLGDRDPRVRAHALGKDGRDRLAGLGAVRVDDPATRVAALAAEAVVELDAELDELLDARGRLVDEHRDGALAAEPAAGIERVFGVKCRRVPLPDRSRHAALRVPAVRRVDGGLREQQHVGLLGCVQCRRQTGHSAADHEQPERSRGVVAINLRDD